MRVSQMIFGCAVILLGLAPAAAGQSTTGGLRGVLTDDSGGVVPGASVTISGRGMQRAVGTQADGSYSVNGLAPGEYQVHVAFPGFNTVDQSVTVSAGKVASVPIQLTLTPQKQQVTVEAEAGATVSVEPDNNAAALVLKNDDLEALPDDPDDLQDALQALAGPGAGPNGGSLYVDGFTGGDLPPKESIREVRINQNPFSAEYDKLGFGRIEILTKPGSDRFRGTLFSNYSNAEFNSRNPFASNKPNFSNLMVGGNIGGPINKKSSFFFDFNRRNIQDNAVTNAVYFDPTTFQAHPVTTAVVTPLMNTTIAPRLDYQLTANNTLTVRFEQRMNERDNRGLGVYYLPPPYSELAYNTVGNSQNVTLTETAVLNSQTINETRFQYTRNWTQSLGNEIPQINVMNEFISGGNGMGNSYDLTHHYELHNYTTITRGAHSIRFGGRVRRNSDLNNNPKGFNGAFTFTGGLEPVLNASNQIVYDANGNPQRAFISSLSQYERNVELQAAGVPAAEIQALGGGPSRFTILAGQSYIGLVRWDAGPFIQDDWRARPNLTLSLGLRYETQTLFSDYSDIAPRFGIAWAPGRARKTVIRGGFGIFYDRISFLPFEAAILNNGVNQVQYVVDNPTFNYPYIPPLSTLNAGQNVINRIDPRLRADASLQGALGVERQLPWNSRLSVNYTYDRTNHLKQTVPINTPFPGSYNPLLPPGPDNGVFPYGYSAGNIMDYETGGIMKQHMLTVNLNTRFSRRVSLFANYAVEFANDLPTNPSDPYNFALDWGRSDLERRNNVQVVGSVLAPLGLHFAPFVTIRSGSPYDVLLGTDLYGDTFYNARPAFAPPGACASGSTATIKCTSRGAFDTNVFPGETANIIPRDYLTMPGMVSVNMRVYHVFGFGPVRGGNRRRNNRGGRGPDGRGPDGGRNFGGGGRGGRGGRGGGFGGFGGGESTEHRFNLTVGMNVVNILNHFNPGAYQGVLSSTQFGEPTTVNTGFGGGFVGAAGGTTANNRRLEFQMRFAF